MPSSTTGILVTDDKNPWPILKVVDRFLSRKIEERLVEQGSRLSNENFSYPNIIYCDTGIIKAWFNYEGHWRSLTMRFNADSDIPQGIEALQGQQGILFSMRADAVGCRFLAEAGKTLARFGDFWYRETDQDEKTYQKLYAHAPRIANSGDFRKDAPFPLSRLYRPSIEFLDERLWLMLRGQSGNRALDNHRVAEISPALSYREVWENRDHIIAHWRLGAPNKPLDEAEVRGILERHPLRPT